MCDDVDVVHVGCGCCLGDGTVELFVGFGEGGVEGEREGGGRERAAHGHSAIGGVCLCVGVVDAALVCGLGKDPGPKERLELRVVLLDGLDNGGMVEVGESGLDVD